MRASTVAMRFASSARPSRYSASALVLPELALPELVLSGLWCPPVEGATSGLVARSTGGEVAALDTNGGATGAGATGATPGPDVGNDVGPVGTVGATLGIDVDATGAVCAIGARLGTDVGATGAAWATLAGATGATGTVGATLGADVGATGAGATLGAAAATLGRAGAILGGGGSTGGGGSPGCTAAFDPAVGTTRGFHSLEAGVVAAGVVAAGLFSADLFSARPANFPGGHEVPRRTSPSRASGGPSLTFCGSASFRVINQRASNRITTMAATIADRTSPFATEPLARLASA